MAYYTLWEALEVVKAEAQMAATEGAAAMVAPTAVSVAKMEAVVKEGGREVNPCSSPSSHIE